MYRMYTLCIAHVTISVCLIYVSLLNVIMIYVVLLPPLNNTLGSRLSPSLAYCTFSKEYCNPNKFLVPPCFSYFFSSCTCREIEKVFLFLCCYEGGNKLGLNFKIQNPYNFRLLQRLWTFIYCLCLISSSEYSVCVSDSCIWTGCYYDKCGAIAYHSIRPLAAIYPLLPIAFS